MLIISYFSERCFGVGSQTIRNTFTYDNDISRLRLLNQKCANLILKLNEADLMFGKCRRVDNYYL